MNQIPTNESSPSNNIRKTGNIRIFSTKINRWV
jgi:hypothetical protein